MGPELISLFLLITAAAAAAPAEPWRSSLSVCWTDATCRRAMSVAHGGDWARVYPVRLLYHCH